MKPINKLTREEMKKIKTIVFDVDGVLVPRGTKIKQNGNVLTITTKVINPIIVHKLHTLSNYYHINISSGRSLTTLMEMFRPILSFVSLTYENGSATWEKGEIKQHVNSFFSISLVYDMIKDHVINHKNFKGFEPKEFILTIHCTDIIPKLKELIVNGMYCIWNGEAYDIGLKNQTKGNIIPNNSLVIGDNYNDKEMLNKGKISVTADKDRVSGDYYIPLKGKKLPGEVLIDAIKKLTI